MIASIVAAWLLCAVSTPDNGAKVWVTLKDGTVKSGVVMRPLKGGFLLRTEAATEAIQLETVEKISDTAPAAPSNQPKVTITTRNGREVTGVAVEETNGYTVETSGGKVFVPFAEITDIHDGDRPGLKVITTDGRVYNGSVKQTKTSVVVQTAAGPVVIPLERVQEIVDPSKKATLTPAPTPLPANDTEFDLAEARERLARKRPTLTFPIASLSIGFAGFFVFGGTSVALLEPSLQNEPGRIALVVGAAVLSAAGLVVGIIGAIFLPKRLRERSEIDEQLESYDRRMESSD